MASWWGRWGAGRAYEVLPDWDPVSLSDLLAAHALMMGDVLKEAGVLRRKGVGIQKGERLLHIHQQAYYDALSGADQASDSTGFVAFMLDTIEEVLHENAQTTQETTQKIIRILKRQPTLTRKELAGVVGITPDGVKYHLDKLRKAGVIRHVGATKTGHWEVLK